MSARVFAAAMMAAPALAATNFAHNLVADTDGVADHTDPNLAVIPPSANSSPNSQPGRCGAATGPDFGGQAGKLYPDCRTAVTRSLDRKGGNGNAKGGDATTLHFAAAPAGGAHWPFGVFDLRLTR